LLHADLMAAKPGERFLATWIKIANDGAITVMIPHCDMGTGIFTSLSQMAAEELDADWSMVHAETAPADPLFANTPMAEGFALEETNVRLDSIPGVLRGTTANSMRIIAEYMDLQTTGGSSAVRFTGMYGMRIAGAAVREMLVKAAAAQMTASTGAFRTERSRVIHMATGKSFGYGELATAAAEYTPSAHPALKARDQYTLVGKPVARFDIPAKVHGAANYGIDTKVPGMCYAAIRISPVFGGKLVSVNEAAVTGRSGVKQVIKLEDAAVVVADRFWRARDAAAALEPVFDHGNNAQVSSGTIRDAHLAALKNGQRKVDLSTGSGADGLKEGKVVERIYNVPYLAHAAMEPANATALYTPEGELEVWAGTQDGLGSRAFCAKSAGLPLDKVTFHLLPSGGGFGRRLPGQWNFLMYAVKSAMAVPGVPVKLIFTREQDLQHDYYRPNVSCQLRAALTPDGVRAWACDYTTDEAPNEEAHIFYEVPNQVYSTVKLPAPVPTGPWRSVEASWHGFFVESFVDELAQEAHRDPLEFRRGLLQKKPRHLGTLNLAAEKSGWGSPLPAGRGRGIAMFECFGSVVAHVAEVEVGEDAKIKVRRVTSAIDCGMAVNPDGLRAQLEGAVVFGLSAALFGEITINEGAVVQRNFPDFSVVRLRECPEIDVHIHESEGPVGGVGEPGVPPVAPAVVNAIFAATGMRIRELPVKNHSFRS
jgi:isoquinoline 1-oxidoreductase beta subunit